MATTFMTKTTNAADFQTQIDNLNTKLDSVAKNLTYFDFYNIVDVTVNKNNFSAQVNALTPNTSLIINSEPFFVNNIYYNTGDIIFKSSNSNIVHIKAQTGGIYYPNKITKSNDSDSYSIEYKYTPTQPATGSSTDVDISIKDQAANGAAEIIKFNGLTTHTPSTIYGLWKKFTSSFPAHKKDGTVIQPYIKFYLCDGTNNTNYEEICLDYSLTCQNENTDNPTWNIEISDSDEEFLTNIWMKVK